MNLEDMRKQIDTLDQQLLALFLQRMSVSDQVAAYKAAQGLPILNQARERQILDAVAEKSGDMELYANRFFSEILQLSRARQAERITGDAKVTALVTQALEQGWPVFPKTGLVACQGVEGANAQSACDKLLPRGRIVYVKSFEGVFEAVNSGLCQFGVLPIENSLGGSIREVYELLQRWSFYIVRSTRLNIRHELLANPGTKLSDIREIYSHPQAISQCDRFLSTCKDVKIIPMANTAVAAREVAASAEAGKAAISSHACAALYGLEPVRSDIQDNDNNYTRFLCVTKQPQIYEGANRVSLVLDCANTPGSLYALLARIAAQGINMTKLESCPVWGRSFEYVFFLDLELSVKEPGALGMLADLERASQGFHFLGGYQEV